MVPSVEKVAQRSPLTDRYPRVFVESVLETSLPLPGEKESSMSGKKKLGLDIQQLDTVFKYSLSSNQFFFLIYNYVLQVVRSNRYPSD